ncbi:accessory gene regulator B family protein [Clostridium sp. CF011]|uniref:accessory gene regulator B family protein n=1 Tax=Clostridium sp. CF011 TaxID=2843318 RepID=UPI001C0CC45B|nr:accessory gene regulator B family protein [Clostridium sp. CF011]MBU3092384.1 accessory gene regulator B family protein [Clostridium sp. CF011]WAG68395.1 accessory gene regulator B family protein [Clostridium sp. CF011]
MNVSKMFSTKISNHIKKVLPDKTEEDLEIIQYGIEVLFMNLTKFPIILGVGYLLGILKYTVCTLIIFSIVRGFASGIHARHSYTCLISTMVTILGSVYLSLYLNITIITRLICFLLIMYIYFKYAPADTEEKPYLDPLIRKNLKLKSILIAIIYFIISISVDDTFFSNIFIYVLYIEGILISPLTYKLLNRRYNNYEYYR